MFRKTTVSALLLLLLSTKGVLANESVHRRRLFDFGDVFQAKRGVGERCGSYFRRCAKGLQCVRVCYPIECIAQAADDINKEYDLISLAGYLIPDRPRLKDNIDGSSIKEEELSGVVFDWEARVLRCPGMQELLAQSSRGGGFVWYIGGTYEFGAVAKRSRTLVWAADSKNTTLFNTGLFATKCTGTGTIIGYGAGQVLGVAFTDSIENLEEESVVVDFGLDPPLPIFSPNPPTSPDFALGGGVAVARRRDGSGGNFLDLSVTLTILGARVNLGTVSTCNTQQCTEENPCVAF